MKKATTTTTKNTTKEEKTMKKATTKKATISPEIATTFSVTLDDIRASRESGKALSVASAGKDKARAAAIKVWRDVYARDLYILAARIQFDYFRGAPITESTRRAFYGAYTAALKAVSPADAEIKATAADLAVLCGLSTTYRRPGKGEKAVYTAVTETTFRRLLEFTIIDRAEKLLGMSAEERIAAAEEKKHERKARHKGLTPAGLDLYEASGMMLDEFKAAHPEVVLSK